jgi:hypothetical protein
MLYLTSFLVLRRRRSSSMVLAQPICNARLVWSTNFKFSPLRGQERALVVQDVTDGQLLHFAGEPFNPGLKGKKSLVRIDENLYKLTAYSSIWLSGFLWDMIRRIEAISSGVKITSWPVCGSLTVRQKLDRPFDPRFNFLLFITFANNLTRFRHWKSKGDQSTAFR